MKKTILSITLFLFLLIPIVNSQIYLGVSDGFVFDAAGATVPGVTVTATVVGCSTSNCAGSAISQSNGFYFIPNLNMPTGGTVNLVATAGIYSGTAIGTSDPDETYVSKNITIAAAPMSPSLTDEPNTLDTNVTLNWVSGVDQNVPALAVHDEFKIDSDPYTTDISPVTLTGLSIGLHTWRVRTCNAYKCSAESIDTFYVINDPPTAAVLNDVPSSGATDVNFSWTSGVDPEGRPTRDEFVLKLNNVGGAIVYSSNNATSPINISALIPTQTYFWSVRTCDEVQCGSYDTSTFTVVNNAPSAPSLNLIDYINNDTVTFSWISGIDPDADITYDEFQLSTKNDFSSFLIDNTNATSPITAALSYFEIYYWRVRTCDPIGQCSSYQSEGFFTYLGNGTITTVIVEVPGDTGGGGSSQKPKPCQEEWVCDDWGECILGGYQFRECYDKAGCASFGKPDDYKTCTFLGVVCIDDSDCGDDYECKKGVCVKEEPKTEEEKKEEKEKTDREKAEQEEKEILEALIEAPIEIMRGLPEDMSLMDKLIYTMAATFFLLTALLGIDRLRTGAMLAKNAKKLVKLSIKHGYGHDDIQESLKHLNWSKKKLNKFIREIDGNYIKDNLSSLKKPPQSPKL